MHQYDILPSTDGVRVKATGSTRAGLLTAAIEGMFAATKPRWEEGKEETERAFSVSSAGFPALLVAVLTTALAAADANHEAYSTVKFTLITDTKAEGSFIGKSVSGVETRIASVTPNGLAVEKNADGAWETTVEFQTK